MRGLAVVFDLVRAILPRVSVAKVHPGRIEGLPLMSTRDKRSSYLAIRSCFSALRVSYALSQRERSVAKSSVMSAAWSPVSLWDISTTVLALGLFGEVCNTVSDVVEGTAAGSEAKASVVDCWMGGIAVVDGAACSGGRRTTFARACQRGKGEFTAVQYLVLTLQTRRSHRIGESHLASLTSPNPFRQV
jgi:hypothetical protein